jgi:hypothetical protein
LSLFIIVLTGENHTKKAEQIEGKKNRRKIKTNRKTNKLKDRRTEEQKKKKDK